MLTILRNDYSRMRKRLAGILIFTVVTLVAMGLAVYLAHQPVKGHIALVTANAAAPVHSARLDVTVLRKAPPESALVRGQYDAFVFDEGGGRYRVQTLRNAQFKAMVQALLTDPQAKVPSQSGERGVGENVIGFSMLFLLMSTITNLLMFGEDKEQGQLSRIEVTPVSGVGYLAGHCVYALTMFLPPLVLLAGLQEAGVAIGFSLGMYALLFLALAVLGIPLALLLYTLLDKADNATMLGSSILVFTTVLAGGFYANSRKNAVLDTLVGALPQKQLLLFAAQAEKGVGVAHAGHLLYVFAWGVALFALSGFLLRRRRQRG
ncbi:ABC transporter permease [Ethanoligenens harbinense]|uniref:ABC-2 type transporter transmembrane domain-containing protein n=1 Tax=Ethanoligenens harbinense (strain DSM 18485 / JCM 12961 / CGMCC 1.5033 / YUAN-3) TaxID=663278 RepID=E6U8K0_ETHHY|nr:ABC transporter permease [Ethanoligenens harbinense]ADU25991.1 hypothetical protein Ethha_0406 [Ethanoligenens harbinense YUAN-3]AVQ95139.1 ABC transporter permease [Ethanoligenens harbinense YUAN-3]AYF37830.1 ABC transporter permease [Ethanoligenens harbinense]AYF40552.1 ABC transporter permease [Ethanoligenens harbinense]QCN91385.1 ABC transporter permease [Ethanoligenens harbinense]